MQYHLVLTERCNLHCTYCGGTRHQEGLPMDPAYTMEDLKAFIGLDPEPVIGFYGGEPLLAIDFMYRVMDSVPAKAYTLQTNTTHLAEVENRYLHRLHSILVSIDGPREVTDACRGRGTYDSVLRNLRDVEERGYEGDVVARMAYSDHGDIHRDVAHLLSLESPAFDHVHWQLDVFWSDLETRSGLGDWLNRYDKGITRLVRDFGDAMKQGRVLGVVPFIPVLRTLITGEPVRHIWCGSGRDSFAIMTSGDVHVCPVAPELPYSKVGSIHTSTPQEIRDSLSVAQPCDECGDLWVCGGRCLYANQTVFWGRGWFDRVCESTRHMIEELEGLVPLARGLMEEGVLPPDAFDYPALNNGCEIIP
ncbi:MAG: TIGR04084 family radical SAM/SPASM domain-containing protein [Candidatus Bathyarchaeota archaeon]